MPPEKRCFHAHLKPVGGIPKEYHAWFRDITSGSVSATGWAFCSGVGNVLTYKGK